MKVLERKLLQKQFICDNMVFEKDFMNVVYMPVSDTIDTGSFNNVLNIVSDQKKDKVASYLAIERKMSLYAEAVVRSILHHCYDLDNKDITFGSGEFGKPYVNNIDEFHFNISHTRNGIAVAFSDRPVGIDIERIQNDDRGVAERFFVSDEFEYIYDPVQEREKRFFEIWTKKEAYIKCKGKGLSMDLTSFDVLNGCIRSNFDTFYVDDYIISVFQEERSANFDFYTLDEDEFLKMILEL